jgi:hypothetical protein
LNEYVGAAVIGLDEAKLSRGETFRVRTGFRISQSLSTHGSSNRQTSVFSSIHQAATLHSASNSQRDMAHKFDCCEELGWDQPPA